MKLESTSYFYSAVVTIECATPLSIKGDDADLSIDVRLVRDANGFPMIPGTTIAGVLRSVASGDNQAELFGHASNSDSKPSSIQVGFGFCHNGHNRPVSGLIQSAESQTDQLLTNLVPLLRDQVKLNEYGSAVDGAKLDRTALPKGTRFSFEISWSTAAQNDEQWKTILSWLHHPEFRLGGLTHRGFGQIKVIEIKSNQYDFKNPKDLEQWQVQRKASAHLPFTQQSGSTLQLEAPARQADQLSFSLTLEAEDFWRIGEGSFALAGDYDKPPHMKPYTETVIEWNGDLAKLNEHTLVIPATGIKGALRHRTLFHLRRLMNDFSDGITTQSKIIDDELSAIFGNANNKQNDGCAGSITLNDIYDIQDITQANGDYITKVIMHNKIDRFTGGTIDGALFSEQLLYGGHFTLTGQINLKRSPSKELLQAFKAALEDVAQGRLAIGAGSTKGHGYFTAIEQNLNAFEQAITHANAHPKPLVEDVK